MRPARSFLSAVALLAVGACSLIVHFDPEGQACEAGTGACRPGFACVEGLCRAGADAGSDSCGGCPPGHRCRPDGVCVVDTCGNRTCPAGRFCWAASGATSCANVPPGSLGQPCVSDLDCDGGSATWRCAFSAIRPPGSTAHHGVCMEDCTATRTCASDAGCQRVELPGAVADSFFLCLNAETTPRPCSSDALCVSEGLVCTAFSIAARASTTFCDQPLLDGAGRGETCAVPPMQTAEACLNGLCAPAQADAGLACTVACADDAGCGPNERCASVRALVGSDDSQAVSVCQQ